MEQEIRNEAGQTLERFLAAYSPKDYDRPSVTLDIAILTKERTVLLIQRKNHPNIHRWALPGGFLEMDESLYHGAMRELQEETGVTNVQLEPLGMFGAVDRDPRTRIITMAFCAVVNQCDLKYQAGDDAKEAALFAVHVLSMGKISIPEVKKQENQLSLPCTAYGEPLPNTAGNGYVIQLKNEAIGVVSALVAKVGTSDVLIQTPWQEGEGAIAGDHGLILFAALQKVYPALFMPKK